MSKPLSIDPMASARGFHMRRLDRAAWEQSESVIPSAAGADGDGASIPTWTELPFTPADEDVGEIVRIQTANQNEPDRFVTAMPLPDGTLEWRDINEGKADWPAAYLGQWGSNGLSNGQFGDIRGIAVNPVTGDVYVSSDDRIQRFTANGTYISTIATVGSSNGQVNTPGGIAFDPITGNLHVADYGNNRAQEITAAGVFVRTYRQDASSLPVNIATGLANGYSYEFRVLNEDPAEVHGFDPAYVFLNYSTLAPAPGVTKLARRHLFSPAVFGNWLVATFQDWHEVALYHFENLVFGATPNPPTIRIGGLGAAKGKFSDPYDIAIDAQNNIYITDSGNHRIQVFDQNGIFQGQWGRFGDGDGEFNTPTDIAITDEYIYVCDSGNHRVQIFANPAVRLAQPFSVSFWSYAGAIAGTDYQWQNMPAAETEWRGNAFTSGRQYVDLTGIKQARMGAYVNAVGSASALICVQYSTDNGSSWASLAASGRVSAPIAATGAMKGSWTTIAPGARTEVLVRVTGVSGNAVADPQVISAHCQFR